MDLLSGKDLRKDKSRLKKKKKEEKYSSVPFLPKERLKIKRNYLLK